jgi:DinB superfamily
MTTTETVPDAVASAVSALAGEQWRVYVLVDAALAADTWEARLRPEQRRRLVRLGHFPAYSAELDWTPREVAGHLRDSARIFADRIRRIRSEPEPLLADFVTDAPERLADYRSTDPTRLVAELRAAQAQLLQAVVEVRGDDLELAGIHELDGRVPLAGLLAFLPGHQRDHADQLAALLR